MDLIERQAEIDALDCINGVEEVLRSLPSAQPHTYRGVTLNDVMMYFDSLEGNEDAWTEFCSCLECRGWELYHIQSATTDCISRKQAIDAGKELCETCDEQPNGWCGSCRMTECLKAIEALPPAQPDCAKCKSELANKIRGQQDNPGMLTEYDKGRNWGLEWAAQIVEGKR